MSVAPSAYAHEQADKIRAFLAADPEGDRIRALVLGDPEQNGTGDTANPARRLDLAALLDAPLEPIPWRVDRLAADGCLTVLAGHGGEGKSWLALGLAIGVACGSTVGGLTCTKGRALYLDGENGERLIARRYRAANGPRENVAIYEAEALDLASDAGRRWLAATIKREDAQLVVLDSLRTLAPNLIENDGESVAPVMRNLRLTARQTGAAVLVLHHRPKNTAAAYRGSGVLRDQADMLFVLGRADKDPEARTRRSLHADGARGGKMRIDAEPEERWFHLRPVGQYVTLDAAEPPERATDPGPRATDQLAADMLDLLAEHPDGLSRAVLARALDRDPSNGTVRRAVERLEQAGDITRAPNGTLTLANPPGNPAGNRQAALPASHPYRGAGNGKAATGDHT